MNNDENDMILLNDDISMEYDPLILIGSMQILGCKSGVRYDVVINSTETYKYILFDDATVFDSNTIE